MFECIRYFKKGTGRMDKYIYSVSSFFVRYFVLMPEGKPPLHAAFDFKFFFLDWVYCH